MPLAPPRWAPQSSAWTTKVPSFGQHSASIRPAFGQHPVSIRSAFGQHSVSIRSACNRAPHSFSTTTHMRVLAGGWGFGTTRHVGGKQVASASESTPTWRFRGRWVLAVLVGRVLVAWAGVCRGTMAGGTTWGPARRGMDLGALHYGSHTFRGMLVRKLAG